MKMKNKMLLSIFLILFSYGILILTLGIPGPSKGCFMSPAIVDFDKCGVKYIVTVDDKNKRLCIFDHECNLVGTESLPDDMSYSPVSVADIDGDQNEEIIFLGVQDYQLGTNNEPINVPGKISCYIYNYTDNEIMQKEPAIEIEIENIYPILSKKNEINPPIIYDIDNDMELEILFGFANIVNMQGIDNYSQLSTNTQIKYVSTIFSYENNGEVTEGFPFITEKYDFMSLDKNVQAISNLAVTEFGSSENEPPFPSSNNRGIAFTVGGGEVHLISQIAAGLLVQYANLSGYPKFGGSDFIKISGPTVCHYFGSDMIFVVGYDAFDNKPRVQQVANWIGNYPDADIDTSNVKECIQPPSPIFGSNGNIYVLAKYVSKDDENILYVIENNIGYPYYDFRENYKTYKIDLPDNLKNNEFVLNQPSLFIRDKETEQFIQVEGVTLNLINSQVNKQETDGDQSTWAVADLDTDSVIEIVKASNQGISMEKTEPQLDKLKIWYNNFYEKPWPTLAFNNQRTNRYYIEESSGILPIDPIVTNETSWYNPIFIEEGQSVTHNIKIYDPDPYEFIFSNSVQTANYGFWNNENKYHFLKSLKGKYIYNPIGYYISMDTNKGDSGLYELSAVFDNTKGGGTLFYLLHTVVEGPPHDPSITVGGVDNNGLTTSKKISLYLKVFGVGPFQMKIWDGATITSWLPYDKSYPWSLSDGDGIKTIYAEFKDTYGNIQTSTSVELDEKIPIIKVNPIYEPVNSTGRIVTGTAENCNKLMEAVPYIGNPTINSISKNGNNFTIKVTLEEKVGQSAIKIFVKDPKWPPVEKTVYFNYQTVSVPPPPPPTADLIVAYATFRKITPSNKYYITAAIKNIGNGPMPQGLSVPVVCKLYKNILVAEMTKNVANVAVGKYQQVIFPLTLRQYNYLHHAIIDIDPNNKLPESDPFDGKINSNNSKKITKENVRT